MRKITKAKLVTATSLMGTGFLYGSQAISTFNDFKEKLNTYKDSKYHSIKISSKSDKKFYNVALRWLYNQGDFSGIRAYQATRVTRSDSDHEEIRLVPDSKDRVAFVYKGFSYIAEFAEQKTRVDLGDLFTYEENTLYIKCLNKKGIQVIEEKLSTLYEDEVEKKRIFIPSQYGGYDEVGPIPVRELSSVYLKENQVEDLVADVTKFYTSKELYEQNGFPYHRCYLLYGPPGSGKTSLIKALAYHFHKDLYYTSLKMKNDIDLTRLVSGVKQNFLLLEDVDSYHIATDRTEAKDMASTSSLLNALDGVATPSGLVTFMTTNHIEMLDPALLREGRVDIKLELGFLDVGQLTKMFNRYYTATQVFSSILTDIAPAQVAEILKTTEESEVALKKIVNLGVEL